MWSRNFLRHLAMCAVAGFSTSAMAVAAMPSGEWARDDGSVRARIVRCGGKICAVNTWAKDPKGLEKAGDKVIMEVKPAAPGHWTGSAFDPQRKLNFTVDLQVDGDRLITRGCVSGSTACVTADWIRFTK